MNAAKIAGGIVLLPVIAFTPIVLGVVAPIRYRIKDAPPRLKSLALWTLFLVVMLLTPY